MGSLKTGLRVQRAKIEVTGLTGGPGVATASQASYAINGEIRYIDVQYTSAPVTTDVTISADEPYNTQILKRAGKNARWCNAIEDLAKKNDGEAIPGDDWVYPIVRGRLTVLVENANNDTEVTVLVYYV